MERSRSRGRSNHPNRGERLRGCSLTEGQGFACSGEAFLPHESNLGVTPSVSCLMERNPGTGRPGSGGRPFCAASILTRMDNVAQSICETVICGSGRPGAHSCCNDVELLLMPFSIDRLLPRYRLVSAEDRCP